MDKQRLKHYASKVKLESSGLDRKIIAKVVGVTFEGRQELLSKVSKETPISLERDRRNEYDFYAVKVMAFIEDSWQQVGFLPRKMSKMISRSLDQGKELFVSVNKIIGGAHSDYTDEWLNYGLEVNVLPKEVKYE